MPVHPTVEQLARKVRSRVVRWVRDNHAISDDLCGACAIGSYTLWKVLRAKGRRASLVVLVDDLSGHCWVELSGHIIDITATQFHGPRIAIFKIGEWPEWSKTDEYDPYQKEGDRFVNQSAVAVIADWQHQSPQAYERKISRLAGLLVGDELTPKGQRMLERTASTVKKPSRPLVSVRRRLLHVEPSTVRYGVLR